MAREVLTGKLYEALDAIEVDEQNAIFLARFCKGVPRFAEVIWSIALRRDTYLSI